SANLSVGTLEPYDFWSRGSAGLRRNPLSPLGNDEMPTRFDHGEPLGVQFLTIDPLPGNIMVIETRRGEVEVSRAGGNRGKIHWLDKADGSAVHRSGCNAYEGTRIDSLPRGRAP
ncbi:MAG: hypothetical protein ACREX6_11890, partial [Casimicrobiaceae bacterium]